MLHRLRKLSARRLRRPLLGIALGMIAVGLVLPTAALAAGFTIRSHIANHTPIAGKRWPVELTITKGRRKLTGTVRYQFMFAGVVVRTQPRHGAFRFKHGVYRDELVFPKQSLGERLTLRFLVKTRYGTEHTDWALETRR
ncbi:MAG: hypothetical protein ACRDLT_15590 [Solirubrobacteraceae bacterium]